MTNETKNTQRMQKNCTFRGTTQEGLIEDYSFVAHRLSKEINESQRQISDLHKISEIGVLWEEVNNGKIADLQSKIDSSTKKLQFAEKRIRTLRQAYNLDSSDSENRLMIQKSYDFSYTKDFVSKKCLEIALDARENVLNGKDKKIVGCLHGVQIVESPHSQIYERAWFYLDRMTNRTMTEEEYNYILNTDTRELIKEWRK